MNRIRSWPRPLRWAAAAVLTAVAIIAIPVAAFAGALVSAKRREGPGNLEDTS